MARSARCAQVPDGAYSDFTKAAVTAIKAQNVPRVVSITALGRGTPWELKSGLVTASIRMDDLLMETGAAFRGLAMPSFMDDVMQQTASMLERGQIFGTLDPDNKLPTTATRDMGAAAAYLLAHEHWADQKEIGLLGPEELSMNDMAATVSDVLGRPVTYQQVFYDAFKMQLLARGMSESFAQGYLDMMRAKNDGMDNAATPDKVIRTTTTFERWCEEDQLP